MEQDYIKNLRKKVGYEPLILNFAGGVLVNDQDETCYRKGRILNHGGCRVEQWNLENLLKKHVFVNF